MSAWDLQFPALDPEWDYGDGQHNDYITGDGEGAGLNVLPGEALNNGWGTPYYAQNGPQKWLLSVTGDGGVPEHLGAHNVVPRSGRS